MHAARQCGIWLFAVTVSMCCLVGCVAIPMGTEVLETKEVGREHKTDETLQSAQLSLLGSETTTLNVELTGEYDTRKYDEVTLMKKVKYRRLVIGIFPGIGSRWWVGDTEDCVGEAILGPLGIPLTYIVLFSPTWVTWFTEFGRDWNPCSAGYKGQKFEDLYETPYLSLVGWSKTARSEDIPLRKLERRHNAEMAEIKADTTLYDSLRTEELAQCESNHAEERAKISAKYTIKSVLTETADAGRITRPVKDARLALRIPALDFIVEAKTDSRGRAQFDLARFPILSASPLKAEISTVELSLAPNACTVELV